MLELSKNTIAQLVRYNSGVLNFPQGDKRIDSVNLEKIIDAIMADDYTMTGNFKKCAKKFSTVKNDRAALAQYLTDLAYNWGSI